MATCQQLLHDYWTAFNGPRSKTFSSGLESLLPSIEELDFDSTNAAIEELAMSVRDLYQACDDPGTDAESLSMAAIEHAYRSVFEASCIRDGVEPLSHILARIEGASTGCQEFIYYTIAAVEVIEDMDESGITHKAVIDAIAELQAGADNDAEE